MLTQTASIVFSGVCLLLLLLAWLQENGYSYHTGLCDAGVQAVFRSVVVAKILYASAAWIGFVTATDRQRVDAFLRRSKRCGFCPSDLPSFDELLEYNDDKLFNQINNNVEHLLYSLFPPLLVAPEHYEQRVHNISLSTRIRHLSD